MRSVHRLKFRTSAVLAFTVVLTAVFWRWRETARRVDELRRQTDIDLYRDRLTRL